MSLSRANKLSHLKTKFQNEPSSKKSKKVKAEKDENLASKMDEEIGDFGEIGESTRTQSEMMTEQEIMDQEEDVEFEDAYDDEFEKEDGSEEASEHSSDFETESEGEGVKQERPVVEGEKKKLLAKKEKKKDKKEKFSPFVGTEKNMEQDEELDFENRAYDMLHRATTEFACLSCDWLSGAKAQDKLYSKPTIDFADTKYPLDLYAVAGSQATMPSKNQIYVLRYSNLCQTKYDDDSEEGAQGEETEEIAEGNPVILQRTIPCKGGINRIRSMMNMPIVACWTELADIKIFNVQAAMDEMGEVDISKMENSKSKGQLTEDSALISKFRLQNEGFGLEWSPLKVGRLLSGDTTGKINVFESEDELCSKFNKANYFYSYHTDSVEDIQFSPSEESAFATCSVDGTVQVVDMRMNSYKKAQICIKAHDCDVNVISWNTITKNLIASGGDDGSIKVWDLRYPAEDVITNIRWHQESITSLQWQPDDEWTLAASSADNRLSIWDFSVENNEQYTGQDFGVPEQVIFLHHGQQDIKEVRWHPQYKGVLMSTAHSGFNLFKPAINEDAASEDSSEDDKKLDLIPIL